MTQPNPKNNLRMGNPAATFEQVMQAAKLAGIHTTPQCQTSCRPTMIAEDPRGSAIYEQKFTFT